MWIAIFGILPSSKVALKIFESIFSTLKMVLLLKICKMITHAGDTAKNYR